MPFSPDADANYVAYLAKAATYTGPERQEFEDRFVRYLCSLATASTTLNTAAVNTALTIAHKSLRSSKDQF